MIPRCWCYRQEKRYTKSIMLPIWFSAFTPGVTWLDALLLIVLLFYTIEGLEEGIINALCHCISFLGAFLVGLLLCDVVGSLFPTAYIFASAVSFFLIGIVSFFFFVTACGYGIKQIVKKNDTSHPLLISTILGVFPGFVSGCLLLLFLLILAVTLPISPVVKRLVTNSYIGSIFLIQAQQIEQVIHGQPQDTLLFSTLTPGDVVVKQLGFTIKNTTTDEAARRSIFAGIAAARSAAGLPSLVLDPLLSQVAQERAVTMLQNGYLSYVTKEGFSLSDRMAERNMVSTTIGEAVAFSPNIMLAMSGFMGDQKEKNIILSGSFHRVGIGVADGGMYGKIFVLDFAD